jgi:hypothetical protein
MCGMATIEPAAGTHFAAAAANAVRRMLSRLAALLPIDAPRVAG